MAIKNSLFIIIVIQFFNCAGTNYKKLSIENPAKLVAVQDSLLLVSGDNQRIRDALVTANNSVAKRYLNIGDLKFRAFIIRVIPNLKNIILIYKSLVSL